MANQSGIAITITAFLPTGKTLDQQFAALSLVKTAHETGAYADLLSAATDLLVKTEQKTRRVELAPVNQAPTAEEIDQANFKRGYEAGAAGVQTISQEDVNSPGYTRGYDAGYTAWDEAQRPQPETPPAPTSSPEIGAVEQPATKKKAAATV